MARITAEVEVEVDISDHLDDVATFELVDELESRTEFRDSFKEFTSEHVMMLENLYYALRDGTQEDAIKIINPMLDEKIGRRI